MHACIHLYPVCNMGLNKEKNHTEFLGKLHEMIVQIIILNK